jgi:predicted negative regulator of RcsB-dependent stress response
MHSLIMNNELRTFKMLLAVVVLGCIAYVGYQYSQTKLMALAGQAEKALSIMNGGQS